MTQQIQRVAWQLEIPGPPNNTTKNLTSVEPTQYIISVACCFILANYINRQRIYTRLPGGSPRIKMVIYTTALQDPQPNRLYTRLPGVNQHKIAIYTAAVPEPIQIVTRQPCIYPLPHGVAIYTAAIPEPIQIYTRQPCIYPLAHEVAFYTAAIQDSSWLYSLQPGAYKNRSLHGSRSRANSAVIHCCRVYK